MNNLVDKCILLLTLAFAFLMLGAVGYKPKKVEVVSDIIVNTPSPTPTPSPSPTLIPSPTPPETIEINKEIRRRIGEVELTGTRLEYLKEYRVFLTAYCAEECGWNYYTSSGTLCHRSSDFLSYEPTTCAVDLRYFSYGTKFYVPSEGRVYIAEDTGPGVRGMWIDTYQDDMSDVYEYNTRYETVYVVDFEEYAVQASNYDIQKYIDKEFFEER